MNEKVTLYEPGAFQEGKANRAQMKILPTSSNNRSLENNAFLNMENMPF